MYLKFLFLVLRDGGLKRSAPKKEWKEQYQQEFSRRLKVQNVNTVKKEEKTEWLEEELERKKVT